MQEHSPSIWGEKYHLKMELFLDLVYLWSKVKQRQYSDCKPGVKCVSM